MEKIDIVAKPRRNVFDITGISSVTVTAANAGWLDGEGSTESLVGRER